MFVLACMCSMFEYLVDLNKMCVCADGEYVPLYVWILECVIMHKNSGLL